VPDVQIDQLHSQGAIIDAPPHQMPPEAWEFANGIEFSNLRARRREGWAEIFGPPTVTPHYLMGLLDGSRSPWWIYTSLTKAFVYSAGVHTNITRQAAGVDVDYNAGHTMDWNGDILGGIPILNNGVDVPQFWASYSAGQKLQDLNNWPANLRAKKLLAFGPFLFALNCFKSGNHYPHLVKWSHPAAPGALPISWDETDVTRDTGEYEIPSPSPGGIVTAAVLKDHLYIFKEGVIYRATYIGGRAVFAFQAFSTAAGAIGPKAVLVTPNGNSQVFISDDDVLLHDGQQIQSIADKRIRAHLFNSINPLHREKSFCFANPLKNEVWLCIPTGDREEPCCAYIWNATDNVWSTLYGQINFRGATSGPIAATPLDTWSSIGDTWDAVEGLWGGLVWGAVLVAAPGENKIGMLNAGFRRFTTMLPSRLLRTELALIGRDQSGQPVVDFKRRKLITRIWPKAEGKFEIRLGAQEGVGESVTWSDWQMFDADVDKYLDFVANGRAMALEVRAVEELDFALIGYKIELRLLGNF
jgi:hypothetical protein